MKKYNEYKCEWDYKNNCPVGVRPTERGHVVITEATADYNNARAKHLHRWYEPADDDKYCADKPQKNADILQENDEFKEYMKLSKAELMELAGTEEDMTKKELVNIILKKDD